MWTWLLVGGCGPGTDGTFFSGGYGGELDAPSEYGRMEVASGRALGSSESWPGAVLFELEGTSAEDRVGDDAAGLGDLDGDGAAELAFRVHDGLRVLAAGAVVTVRTGWAEPADAPGDTTGDGAPDLLAQITGGATALWSGSAALVGDDPTTVVAAGSSGDSFTFSPAGDVDGDGVADLLRERHVGSGVAPQWAVARGPFVGEVVADALPLPPLILEDPPESVVAAGDLDDDGLDDLAGLRAPDTVVIYRGADPAVPVDLALPAAATPATALVAPGADLAGDGTPELVVGVGGETPHVAWFTRPDLGAGVLPESPALRVEGPADVLVVDLDGDGVRELMTITGDADSVRSLATLAWHRSVGLDGRTLDVDMADMRWVLELAPHGWSVVAAGDLDADGIGDLVVADPAAHLGRP